MHYGARDRICNDQVTSITKEVAMATKKVQALKFGSVNKAKLKLKFAHKRTRTGAYKTPNRVKAHGNSR